MSGLPAAADLNALQKKAAVRLLPLIVLLYIVSYLDRANVAFAKDRMAQDLKFSDEVFGIGFGIFFIGYLILEIPGALLVEHWSARKWFTRILITWGLISACMAFVRTETHFYAARFALGVAEAGFFPGIIVYFTHCSRAAFEPERCRINLCSAVQHGARCTSLLADPRCQLAGTGRLAVDVHLGRLAGSHSWNSYLVLAA